MKYLKLFESFRQPSQITSGEVRTKLNLFGREGFLETEKNFFVQLVEKNRRLVDDYLYPQDGLGFSPSEMLMSILSLNSDIPEQIFIRKLGDDRYIITQILSLYDEDDLPEDPQYKYYEADEWEEVLGFLSSKTLLELPTS
jgi:hypothetical protein